MPVYINRNLEEVAFGLRCPFCSNNYKSKSGLITHAKHCSENTDPKECLEHIIIWEDYSVSDLIIWQDEITKLAKELIISNEMLLIQGESPEQIRDFIRNKIKNRTCNNYIEEYDIYRIYEFFFGLSETDKNNRKEEQCARIMKMFYPQDNTN